MRLHFNVFFYFSGLYGNDDLHNGLLELLTAGRKVDNLVSSVRNQTNALEHTLTQKIRPQLTELADIFDEPVSNQTALSMLITSLDMVQKNITIATNAAGDIRRPLMGISLNHILNVSAKYIRVDVSHHLECIFSSLYYRKEISMNLFDGLGQ